MIDLDNLRAVRVGLALGLGAVALGFVLGAAFGAAEDRIKAALHARAEAVFAQHYQNDTAKRDKVSKKAWVYMKRAHLHANALGTLAIALCLWLGVLPGRRRLRAAAAALVGAGGLSYGLFWLLAAWRAPGLGGTGAAKDSLAWLAIPSVVALVGGFIMACGLIALSLRSSSSSSSSAED